LSSIYISLFAGAKREERWEPSEIAVLSPGEDEEMLITNPDDEHDRVLYVWWD
jgi:hypothetical protein